MPVVVASEESRTAWAPPETKPLDEAAWQAWVAKGHAQDLRRGTVRMKAVKWASIAGLLAAAGLGSHVALFDSAVRFLVTASAMAVMFQAFQARRYAVAAVFGALVLLYNPVAPVFSFSGNWQAAVVVASAVPFVASLALSGATKARTEHND